MQWNRIAVKTSAFILNVNIMLGLIFLGILYYQNFSRLACFDISMLAWQILYHFDFSFFNNLVIFLLQSFLH